MNSFVSRMDGVQAPVIPLVGQLVAANPGTISLGQGIVFYSPPPSAIAALSEGLADPSNHQYKPVQGIQPLLQAIATKLQQDNGIGVEPSKNAVFVTAGANMAFMNALLAITSPGDEIILNTPYYFNHEMAIRMADCQPVLVPTDGNYQLQLEAIAAAITPKTRAMVTISPNNPTGAVYPESALREVNQLCRDRGIYHISDEAYEYFTYEGVKHFSPAAIPDSQAYTISLFSLSKAYGFAGWRIGYMVVPAHLFLAIQKIQDTILICPPVMSQYAAYGALKTGSSYCQPYLEEIYQNRRFFLKSLTQIRDLCTVIPTQGAFYFFLKINTTLSDFELVKRLIEKYGVATLPGSTFGMTDGCYLRVAYGALRQETAYQGIERLVTGLRELQSFSA
ncbi:MAG: pyridoxal phosphate-dependent aminotransferase [Snowella sp.]|nr:pyridoxal phosphate-dependent aminotransferase [Snowella sp.]